MSELLDSFMENEKRADQLAQQDKHQKIHDKIFQDDRVPTSLQGKRQHEDYRSTRFQDLDERPSRERTQPITSSSMLKAGKENQRRQINIDETEDTFHNQDELAKILARGQRLKDQMDQALDSNTAWESLHGQHQVPKKYVPPFLQKEEAKYEENDRIYEIEIEGYDPKTIEKHPRRAQIEEEDAMRSVSPSKSNSTGNLTDMKFLKTKIISLRIDNEELLHQLIDGTFTMAVEMPLPDIYSKKISIQQLKLSNYDVVSFNQFDYNNSNLYNFKVDEETLSKFIQSQLRISLEGLSVSGHLSMTKLVMAKNYKLEITIPLERHVKVEDPFAQAQQKAEEAKKKDQKKPKGGKEAAKKGKEAAPVSIKSIVEAKSYSHNVGSLSLELSLQRGESDEEIEREYQIRLQKLMEQKALEDQTKQAELEKYMRYTHQQEPTFASLYLYISQIRNMQLGPDGQLVGPQHILEDTVLDREAKSATDIVSQEGIIEQSPLQLKRNLYVQYKGFPGLQPLKTQVAYGQSEPKFQYRCQEAIIVNPDTIEKLERFTFILEVWDQPQGAREEFIGLVRVPLASFVYSMKTNNDQIFSLNFLADQHCLYPMIITDGYLPIYSPRLGQNVGELSLTLALGSSTQVNRQIQKEQEVEKQQLELQMKSKIQEAMRRAQRSAINEFGSSFPVPQPVMRPPTPPTPKTPEKKEEQNPLMGNNLFASIGKFFNEKVSAGRDVDYRKLSHISCLRKLFEESRQANFASVNGDSEVFLEIPKNFDGTIKKDDFVYAILNNKAFTLTRTEIANITSLVALPKDPKSNKSTDGNSIDLDDLNRSYRSYIVHYQSVEGSIRDLLERIHYLVQRKITDNEQYEEFVAQIEQKTNESKIASSELRDIFDNHGVQVSNSQMDQLSSYFDLDRNDQIYVQSLIEYLRNPRMQNFNFFKVHPNIIVNLITGHIKEEITQDPETLSQIELELKREFFSKFQQPIGLQAINPDQTGEFEAGIIPNEVDPMQIPDDILVQEKIPARLFQHLLLKSTNLHLPLWDLFTIFDHLNTSMEPRSFQEPSRYHFISFPHFYRFITNIDYTAKLKEDALRREQRESILRMQREFEEQQQQMVQQQQAIMKASMESAMELADQLNPQKKKKEGESEEGLYSTKSYDQITERDEENDEVVTKKKKKRKEMTFADKKQDSDEDSVDTRPYRKLKHIFEIQVKELKNIPILDKLIKDLNALESAKSQHSKQHASIKKDNQRSRYIQNVAVKYAFPLDEGDEIFQSDFIQLNTDTLHDCNQYDYKVSINTVHNYLMNNEDSIQKLLQNSHPSSQMSLFNISVVIYDGNKEYVIGNAQLAIEDLVDMVDSYQAEVREGSKMPGKQSLQRVVFIYGTTYSQRENCIIGKMLIEINYLAEKQQLLDIPTAVPNKPGEQPAMVLNDTNLEPPTPTCFLHRETFIKRKIPLNAVLSVEIERINNLKESLENIEHFAKIQTTMKDDTAQSHKYSNPSHVSKNAGVIQQKEQTDRRRILTQIFKSGLNLVVIGSVFEEDGELKKKFPMGKHTSRLLFNTLTPIFNEGFEIGIQMDTHIFEYLKNKKAIFEVRHYILDPTRKQNSHHQKSASSVSHYSQNTEENEERELMNDSEYIVLGQVRVPLLHLITKNNGIDGDFVIFDDYKQQMGSLKLRIGLNHHSSKRPLYSDTNKVANEAIIDQRGASMIDKTVKLTQTFLRGSQADFNGMEPQTYLLGLNFVELVFKDRQLFASSEGFMYLKFKLLGQSYQTKFISNNDNSQHQKALGLATYAIKKTTFIELDFFRQQEIEEAFSRPLEVQLWVKKEHTTQRYLQPELEQQLGSFFIELNDLGKMKNKRVKSQNGLLQSYEGYFSLYDFQRQQVVPDRLGCKVLMIKKEYETQLPDLEVLFHNLDALEQTVVDQLDNQVKGYAELDEIQAEVSRTFQDPYQSLLSNYLRTCEFKNQDKVYYSPLFGPLPPFFRYAKRFDSFGVIEKFARELQSIDTHGYGFVPVNLFRSILEHELKIKEKIVLDFINSLRETDHQANLQSLDVNLASNSLRSHIDYVTLLHKLTYYFTKLATQPKTTHIDQNLDGGNPDVVTLRIDIESAMRLRHPLSELDVPNSYVQLTLPYTDATPRTIRTTVVAKSAYPAWHSVNQQARFTLTQETLRHIIDYPLEFEVYHTQQPTAKTNEQLGTQLIGVAYVDLSQMVYVDGVHQISGYFHIMRKFTPGNLMPLVDPHRLSVESLGQIKLSIVSSTNLKRQVGLKPAQREMAREQSPINNFNSRRSMEQYLTGGSYNPYLPRADSSLSVQAPPQSHIERRLEQSFTNAGLELQGRPEADLKQTLQARMSELDQLTRTLQLKANREASPDAIPSSPYVQQSNFAMTIGHGTNQEMRSSFQPFAYHPKIGGAYQLQGTPIRVEPTGFQPSDILEEGDEVERDSFHRENVFENNISRSASSQHSNAATRQVQDVRDINNQLLREQLEEGHGTGEFPREYYDTFNQNQLLASRTDDARITLTTNVFQERIPQQRLSITEHDEDDTQEEQLMHQPAQRGVTSQGEVTREARLQDDEEEEEDEEMTEEEMNRIERIRRGTRE